MPLNGRTSSASVPLVLPGTPNVPTLRSEQAVWPIATAFGSAGPVASGFAIAGCPEMCMRGVPLASYVHVVGKNVGATNVVCASAVFVVLDGVK